MRFLAKSAAVGDLINYGFYAATAVHVDDETTGMEADMTAADQGLRAALGGKNKAQDNLTVVRARQAVPRRRLDTWLRQFEREAKAAFGGKIDTPQYKLILPRSAAKLLKLPLAERWTAVKSVVNALNGADVPKSLKAQQKAGADLIGKLTTCDTDVASAQNHLSVGMAGVQTARTTWHGAYRALHAALTQKHPLDPDFVDSYFLQPSVKAVVKVLELAPA